VNAYLQCYSARQHGYPHAVTYLTKNLTSLTPVKRIFLKIFQGDLDSPANDFFLTKIFDRFLATALFSYFGSTKHRCSLFVFAALDLVPTFFTFRTFAKRAFNQPVVNASKQDGVKCKHVLEIATFGAPCPTFRKNWKAACRIPTMTKAQLRV